MADAIKLHIGGEHPKEGWKILNIMPGPHVDIVGSCMDLSLFADNTVDEVYASHVLEHLPLGDMMQALREIHRVLKPGGLLKGSVPNLEVLARMLLDSKDLRETLHITQMIYGGHINEFDIHHCGFNFNLLASHLREIGFKKLTQVDFLYEFNDTSNMVVRGDLAISLNFLAQK